MAHPVGNDNYSDRVARQRVARIAGGGDKSGASSEVRTPKIAAGRKDGGAVNRADGGAITGSNVKPRLDRPSRKKGGAVKKKQFGGNLPPPAVTAAAGAPVVRADGIGAPIVNPAAMPRGPGLGMGRVPGSGLGRNIGSPVKKGGRVKRADGGQVSDDLRKHGMQKLKDEARANYISPGLRGGSAIDRMQTENIDRVVPRGKSGGGRVKRADGGKVGKRKGNTQVNVIIHDKESPQAGPMPMPMPVPAGPPPGLAGPPPMPPRPPLAAGPGMPAPGGGPPLPIRPPVATGGRVYKRGGKVHSDAAEDRAMVNKMLAQHEKKEMAVEGKLRHRAHGGRTPVPHGGSPVLQRSMKNATPVSHRPMKGTEKANLGRGKVVTYAMGGPVEHPVKGGMAPHLPGGGHGGLARLAKAHRARRNYKAPPPAVNSK